MAQRSTLYRLKLIFKKRTGDKTVRFCKMDSKRGLYKKVVCTNKTSEDCLKNDIIAKSLLELVEESGKTFNMQMFGVGNYCQRKTGLNSSPERCVPTSP